MFAELLKINDPVLQEIHQTWAKWTEKYGLHFMCVSGGELESGHNSWTKTNFDVTSMWQRCISSEVYVKIEQIEESF